MSQLGQEKSPARVGSDGCRHNSFLSPERVVFNPFIDKRYLNEAVGRSDIYCVSATTHPPTVKRRSTESSRIFRVIRDAFSSCLH